MAAYSRSLCSVNRNWKDAVTHSHIFSTRYFRINTESDVQKIKSALFKKPSQNKGIIYIDIDDDQLYEEWSQDNSTTLSAYKVILCFDYKAGSATPTSPLPKNLRTLELDISTIDGLSKGLLHDSLPESLCEGLTHLSLSNIYFQGFGWEAVVRHFNSLRRLHVVYADSGSLPFGSCDWQHMPQLEELEVHNDHYNKLCNLDCIMISDPASANLNNLKSLSATRWYFDSFENNFPNLERLVFRGKMSDWSTIGDKLTHLDIRHTSFTGPHPVFAPNGMKKLDKLKFLRLRRDRPSRFLQYFNDGHYDKSMPDLEEIDVSMTGSHVDSKSFKRFVEAHPKLHTVTVPPAFDYHKLSGKLNIFIEENDVRDSDSESEVDEDSDFESEVDEDSDFESEAEEVNNLVH